MDMYLCVGYMCRWEGLLAAPRFLSGCSMSCSIGIPSTWRFAVVSSLTLYSVSLEICMSFPVAS